MRRTFCIGLTLIGLVYVGGAAAATLSQLHTARAAKLAQLHRDRGTVRFMLNHRWSRRHRGFMRLEKAAERRIALERRQLAALRRRAWLLTRPSVDVARWQPTVNCENSGRWYDSPGYFMYGLQFDPGTWAEAARHTGRWDGSVTSQIINAEWVGSTARRTGQPDPWPNCPDPYFG